MRASCLVPKQPRVVLDAFSAIVRRRSPIARGALLYRENTTLHCVFMVRSGSIKTVDYRHGPGTLTGLHLQGDMLGLIAMATGKTPCRAITLEQTDVCEIPLAALRDLALEFPQLLMRLTDLLGVQLREGYEHFVSAGHGNVHSRLARLLMYLSKREAGLAPDATQFRLRLSRTDLSKWLGVTLETVSRVFSQLQEEGVVRVRNRDIAILDSERLRRLAGLGAPPEPHPR